MVMMVSAVNSRLNRPAEVHPSRATSFGLVNGTQMVDIALSQALSKL
jgi:hypothetical protein